MLPFHRYILLIRGQNIESPYISKLNCCDDIFNVFKRTLEFIGDAVTLLPVVESAFSRELPFQNYLHYIARQNLISGTLEIWIS